MDISITANYFWQKRNCTDRRTPDERIRICADAGFKFMDYSVNVWDDQWEAQTDAIMNAAAKHGLTIDQSHAPFNFYKKAPRDIFDRMLERSVESAIKMGVKALVFHADECQEQDCKQLCKRIVYTFCILYFMLLEDERSVAERGFQKRRAAQSSREMRRLSSCSVRKSSSAIL